jgi:putative heme transporter
MRRILLVVVAAAALITIIVLSRKTLNESLDTFGHLHWPWFLLALAFEAVSLAAFGLSRRRLLRAEGDLATFGSVMAVTYAGNALSMSIPFAGTQLAAVFTYRQFRRHGVGPAVTGWALAVSAILSTSALALILVTGALASGASAATAAGFAGAAVFITPALAVMFALRYQSVRRALHRIIARLVRVSQRLFRWPHFDADGVESFLDRVASIKLSWPRYGEVFALALANWLADCGCLACAILATGQHVPWHGLLLVYGAGAAAGSTGVTPGGFAVVEVTLTAALTAAGLGAAHALAAVLTYRLLNFWLILIGGWITVPVLAHYRPRSPSARRAGDGGAAPDGTAEDRGAAHDGAAGEGRAAPTAYHADRTTSGEPGAQAPGEQR